MSADPELDFELDISGDEVSPEKVLTLTQPTKGLPSSLQSSRCNLAHDLQRLLSAA